MSDSAAITDLNYKDLMPTKAAWLVLFYSDDSDESWNLHPSWERVVEELRDLQVPSSSTASKPNSSVRFDVLQTVSLGCQALGVGRIDIDLDKAARREFIPESDLQPPAIMYRAPDGSKQWCVPALSLPATVVTFARMSRMHCDSHMSRMHYHVTSLSAGTKAAPAPSTFWNSSATA